MQSFNSFIKLNEVYKSIVGYSGTGTKDDPKIEYIWTGKDWKRWKQGEAGKIYKTEPAFKRGLKLALNSGRFDGSNITILTK